MVFIGSEVRGQKHSPNMTIFIKLTCNTVFRISIYLFRARTRKEEREAKEGERSRKNREIPEDSRRTLERIKTDF